MEKDEALRDVKEIKHIMEESRRRYSRAASAWGITLIIVSIAVSIILPFLVPVVGIGLLIGGIIMYRRSNFPLAKGTAAGAIAIGVVMVLLTLIVVLFLMPFRPSW